MDGWMDRWKDGRMDRWMDRVSSGSRTIRQLDHTSAHAGCQSEAMTAGKYQFSVGKLIASMVWARHRH